MKRILLFAIIFIGIQANAQQSERPAYKDMMYDNSINFYDVVKAAEDYFKTIDKNKKGSGLKPFERWREANEYKYYPSGNRMTVDPEFAAKAYSNFLKNNQTSNKLFPNGWEEVGPVTIDSITEHYAAGFGRIEDVYIAPTNPNRIYVGSRSGGFWRSNDGGSTWTGSTTDFLVASGVNSISASPTNPDSVLIALQNAQNQYSHGVYRSTNGGITWTLSNFSPTNIGQGGLGSSFHIYEIAYHPRVPNLVFVCTNDGIYRSTDNLQTWVKLYNNEAVKEIEFHPTNDNIIYIFNSDGTNRNYILCSYDQGLSYSTSAYLINNNNNSNVKISTSLDCPDCLFAASQNGVWKSTDTGANFSFMTNPGQSCDGFSLNDTDTSIMIYGYVDLMRSIDGGQTFDTITKWSLGNTNGAGNGHQVSYNSSTNYIHADVRNARCLNGVFYVTTDGLLAKSTDNGVTWIRLTDGMGIRENYRIGTSQSNHYKVVAGSQDNGTSFSIQDGWVEMYGADGMEAIVHPLNENWFMGSVQYGNRRRTTDAGKTTHGGSPAGTDGAYWIAPLNIDPNNHMTVFDFRDTVYRSDDFGDNHIKLGAPSTFANDIKFATIANNNSNIIVIARDQYIEKSIDGGQTFTSIKNNLPSYSIESIAFDPKNDDVMVVAYGRHYIDNNKVFITTDGGNNWTNITYNLGDMPIRSVVIDHTNNSNIYLGAEIGVYTMPMNGNSWTLYNSGLPNMTVRELEINYGSNTLKAATWGRGVWENALVGRKDFPAIVRTTITSPPTLHTPKKGVDQYVTSQISYDNNLTSVYTDWSINAPVFGNTIPMTNTVDSTWVTTNPLPDVAVGTKVYFKVIAVGNNNDTTETFKFMYEQMPFEHCVAIGDSGSGNLYINNVTMESINNNSNNNLYTDYTSPVPVLYADSSYTIDVSANTGWSSNDFGAWIDFNHDAEFTPDEVILWGIGDGSNSINTFTVPTAVREDTVKMRVRLSYWGSEPKPCGTQFGEVEDYYVKLETNGIPISVETTLLENGLSVYPNPTNGKVYVELNDHREYQFELNNQIGQSIKSGILSRHNNTIDLSNYTMGIYFLKIENQVIKIFKKD